MRGGDAAVVPDLPRVRDVLATIFGQISDAVLLIDTTGSVQYANEPALRLIGGSLDLPVPCSDLITCPCTGGCAVPGKECRCPHRNLGEVGLCRAQLQERWGGRRLEVRCTPVAGEQPFRVLLLRPGHQAPAPGPPVPDPAGTERRWLAAELHDGVTQVMGSLQQRLRVLDLVLARNPDPARFASDVQRLVEVADEGYRELRILLGELRIDELADFGAALRATVANLEGRSGLKVAVRLPAGAPTLPEPVARQVLRILQEALSNARRHSRCAHIAVEWSVTGAVHRFAVSDDGVGFSPSLRIGCFGLCIMRERADAIGARLEVASSPGSGCTVTLTLDLTDRREVVR